MNTNERAARLCVLLDRVAGILMQWLALQQRNESVPKPADKPEFVPASSVDRSQGTDSQIAHRRRLVECLWRGPGLELQKPPSVSCQPSRSTDRGRSACSANRPLAASIRKRGSRHT